MECDVNEVTVFMFSSKTCPPCRVIKPRVERTCEELGVKLEYVDVTEDYDMYVEKVQNGEWPAIRATPTFFVYTLGTFAELRDFTFVTSYSLLCDVIIKIRQELKAPGIGGSTFKMNLN
ncbi:MAG: thioredoxin family protein [Chitinophagaceae bacterium]|nr:thioredoxin family protein [Chitinophagaceae bacterium]